MKIGVISYNFYPLINPRAFRTFELVKEFARLGHEVVVFIPDNEFDYSDLQNQYNNLIIEKVRPGFYLNKNAVTFQPKKDVKRSEQFEIPKLEKTGISKRFKRKLIEWFYPGGFNFEFAYTVSKALRKSDNKFDLCISVGLPLNAHYGLRLATKKRNNLTKVKIADYGDPYSSNTTIQTPFFHKWFEKWILKKFDFIIVPTEVMAPSFYEFKSKDKILVLPQGLDFKGIKLADNLLSDQSNVPVLTYAGNFYKDIRNPFEFLDYLVGLDVEFKFRVYMDMSNADNLEMIGPYIKTLGDRLELNNLLPRNECIYRMSESDFLLNILNTTAEQTPSKLIDYKLSKRPTLTYRPGEFNSELVDQFFNKDYQNDSTKDVSIENFDIEIIVQKILEAAT